MEIQWVLFVIRVLRTWAMKFSVMPYTRTCTSCATKCYQQSTLPAKLLRHSDGNHPACKDKDISFFKHILEKLTSCRSFMVEGRDSSVGIATALRAEQFGYRIPLGARISAPVRTDAGVHPSSYTMGTGSFPGGKAAGAWRWPPTPM